MSQFRSLWNIFHNCVSLDCKISSHLVSEEEEKKEKPFDNPTLGTFVKLTHQYSDKEGEIYYYKKRN